MSQPLEAAVEIGGFVSDALERGCLLCFGDKAAPPEAKEMGGPPRLCCMFEGAT